MRKKRNRIYKRQNEFFRDARLFVIACEGEKTEPNYFKTLVGNSKKVKIEILAPEPEINVEDRGKSAPKWIIDRIANYIDKYGLDENDQLWIVMDIDKWPFQLIKSIHEDCKQYNNWHLALSNPAFEVWLYMHLDDIDELPENVKFKTMLHEKTGGANSAEDYSSKIEYAIAQAEKKDQNPENFMPAERRTKVYLLVKELKKFLEKSY